MREHWPIITRSKTWPVESGFDDNLFASRTLRRSLLTNFNFWRTSHLQSCRISQSTMLTYHTRKPVQFYYWETRMPSAMIVDKTLLNVTRTRKTYCYPSARHTCTHCPYSTVSCSLLLDDDYDQPLLLTSQICKLKIWNSCRWAFSRQIWLLFRPTQPNMLTDTYTSINISLHDGKYTHLWRHGVVDVRMYYDFSINLRQQFATCYAPYTRLYVHDT